MNQLHGVRSLATSWRPRPLTGSAAIIAAWLLVRFVMSFFIHPSISGDQPGYVQAAREVIASHGTILARQSPGYVVFLASVLWLGPRGVYAVQSLLTLGTALFTMRRLGFWQGFVIAACPFFVTWEWELLTETLCFTALWCGWLLIFWRRSAADPALGALCLAIAVLARPILALLPIAAAAVLLFRRQKRKALAVLTTALVPIAAGLIQATGPSYFGMNMWFGTWERNPRWLTRSMTDWPEEAHLTREERAQLPSGFVDEDDRAFLNAAIKRYETAPVQAVSSWFVRYRFLWIGTRTEYTSGVRYTVASLTFKASMWLLNFGVLLFGLLGGLTAFRRRDPEALFLVPIAYVALVYLPFHSTELRYSIVAVPFLLGLAVYQIQTPGNSFGFDRSKSTV